MRHSVGFLILYLVGALAVSSLGCGQTCTAVGCDDRVSVTLVPEIEVTYDVTFVLDGEPGSFTCVRIEEGVWGSPSYVGDCDGSLFGLLGKPESVEITVSAEDGSWNGSLIASPAYTVLHPNGPDCPGVCRQAGLTMTNDLDAFEVQP